MSIEVKKGEQYIALLLGTESVDAGLCEEMKTTVSEWIGKKKKNFIVSMKGVKEVDEAYYSTLDAIITMVLKEDGMLVVAACKAGEMKTFIENKGIISLRSFDEAVDYVFMEEIQKQLSTGGDEDLDDL